jgi:hypothetical protein
MYPKELNKDRDINIFGVLVAIGIDLEPPLKTPRSKCLRVHNLFLLTLLAVILQDE